MFTTYHALLLASVSAVPAGAPPVTAAAFTPDGTQVVVGSQAGIEIRAWPSLTLAGRIRTSLSHVHDLAFSPSGKTLLAAGGSPAVEGSVEILRWPPAGKSQRVDVGKDLVYRVAWSPDGSRWAAAGGDACCKVYAADADREIARYEGHSRPVLAVLFLPDGKTIVSAGIDQALQVWDASTGKPIRTLDNHVAAVNDLALRPGKDGEPLVVSASEDRTVRLWQPATGRLMRFVRLDAAPRAVAWSPDGGSLFVGGSDGRVRILDPESLEKDAKVPDLGERLHTLVPSPDGKSLLLGGALGRLCREAR